jgi:hypothetical protein
MKIVMLVCAEASIIDKYSGSLSLFNIMDKITAVGFPLFVPRLSFVAIVERNAEESDETPVSVEAFLGDNLLMAQEAPLRFAGQTRTTLSVLLHGMPILSPGRLLFRIRIGEVIGEYEIPVERVTDSQLNLFSSAEMSSPISAPVHSAQVESA